jgi:hypothetical protein
MFIKVKDFKDLYYPTAGWDADYTKAGDGKQIQTRFKADEADDDDDVSDD